MDPAAANRQVLTVTRHLVLGALLALIVLGLAWELWLAPTGSRSLALKVLPLAFAVSGVSRMRLWTYRALSLLVWLYVAEGALRATTGSGIAVSLSWLELMLCALLFSGCLWHVRARSAAPREATV
jgi:uncharacterized membrane protein